MGMEVPLASGLGSLSWGAWGAAPPSWGCDICCGPPAPYPTQIPLEGSWLVPNPAPPLCAHGPPSRSLHAAPLSPAEATLGWWSGSARGAY